MKKTPNVEAAPASEPPVTAPSIAPSSTPRDAVADAIAELQSLRSLREAHAKLELRCHELQANVWEAERGARTIETKLAQRVAEYEAHVCDPNNCRASAVAETFRLREQVEALSGSLEDARADGRAAARAAWDVLTVELLSACNVATALDSVMVRARIAAVARMYGL